MLFSNHVFALYGRKCIRIFDPSNGGNGIKLNTPNPIFTLIAICNVKQINIPTVVNTKVDANAFIANNIIVYTIAIIKFITGPARATIASCADIDLFLLKFVGLISTGFPHPK